jgi:phosphatidate cytidylyltransferase
LTVFGYAVDPSSPIFRMGFAVLALLIVSTLATVFLSWRKPEKDWGELEARVRAWWVMSALFFAAVASPDWLALTFFGLLSFWALKEYVTLLKTRPADHKALFFAFAAIPVQYVLIGINWYGLFIIFVPVYLFLLLPVLLVLSEDPKGFVASASEIQWGLMLFVFGLGHLGYILQVPTMDRVNGRTLLLFLVFLTEMSDVLQYVWGKLLGRHKVLPTISPNKTWEGLIGGLICLPFLALALRFLTPFEPLECVGVAVGIGLAGFFGGAVMSCVKRDYGVKDFGAVIPGHGGVIDRLDSLCYAAPLFFHYIRYIY